MMPVSDPDGRITFGIVILFVAAGSWSAESLGRVRYWMLLIAVFGLGMIVSGARQQRHATRVRAEVNRAEAEWTDLLRDAAAARGQGESVARLLQQRGYREFFVRRWIADRLEQELRRGGLS